MRKNNKSALECLDTIYSTIREDDFTDKATAKIRAELSYIKSLYFKGDKDSDIKSAILAAILEHPSGSILENFSRFLNISYIKFLARKQLFQSMEDAGLIRREERDISDCNNKVEKYEYFITDRAQYAIENNMPLAKVPSENADANSTGTNPNSNTNGNGNCNTKDLIRCSAIKPKQLFYNEAEKAQVEQLTSLLDEDKFRQVQSRLEESGLRKGFSVIFTGAPGTGKTATVYELARQTGRDIFFVDMSSIQSKWVGDSEKNIHRVFIRYRELCKQCSRTPILLFNEADAIFGKRVTVVRSVDQSYNAIQNIILQEMENLDGILIATTNLAQNLDPAFERRFIYKIHFKTPDEHTRKQILQSLIPGLSDSDASSLAASFPSFSGGNIENIARKTTVNYILTGTKPDLAALTDLCRSEHLCSSGSRNRVGYCNIPRA